MAGEGPKFNSASLARLLWPVLTGLAAVALLAVLFLTFRNFRVEGTHAVDDARRVVIDIATGHIEVAASLEELAKAEKAKTDQAKADEAKLAAKANAEKAQAKKDAKKAQPADASALPVLKPKQFTGKVSVLVTGLGLNQEWTSKALKLPGAVALSFSPYTVDLATLAAEVKKGGHALFLDLPTETTDYPYTDPGPYALLLNGSESQNMFRLQSLLNLVNDLEGVYFSPSDRLAQEEASIVPVLDRLGQQKKALVFRAEEKTQYVADQAHALGISYQSSYLPLDDVASVEAMTLRMQDLYTRINDNKGNVLVVLKAFPGSIARLERFLQDFTGAGYALAPIGDVLIK